MYTYLKFGLPRVMPPGVEEVGVHSVPIRAGDPGVAAWCHHRGTTHTWPPVGHLEVTFRSPLGLLQARGGLLCAQHAAGPWSPCARVTFPAFHTLHQSSCF